MMRALSIRVMVRDPSGERRSAYLILDRDLVEKNESERGDMVLVREDDTTRLRVFLTNQ